MGTVWVNQGTIQQPDAGLELKVQAFLKDPQISKTNLLSYQTPPGAVVIQPAEVLGDDSG